MVMLGVQASVSKRICSPLNGRSVRDGAGRYWLKIPGCVAAMAHNPGSSRRIRDQEQSRGFERVLAPFGGEPGRHSLTARGFDGTTEDRRRIDSLRMPTPGAWSMVSAPAACDRRLGRCSPLHVLVMLGKYRNAKTGLCVPALERLGKDLGLTRRSVQLHINTLIKCGYVIAQGRRRDNGGWTSNSYIILFPGTESARQASRDDGSNGLSHLGSNTPSEVENALASDAKSNYAYPLSDESSCQPDEDGGTRSVVSRRGEVEFRNPCEGQSRNNNFPSVNPIEHPSAEAVVQGKVAKTSSVLSEVHEAQRRNTLIKIPDMRPASQPGDPVGELIRRIARSTNLPEGPLWADALGWCESLEKAGFTNSEAQALIAEVGKDIGHGNLKGDPIVLIVGRLQKRIEARSSIGPA